MTTDENSISGESSLAAAERMCEMVKVDFSLKIFIPSVNSFCSVKKRN